MSAFALGQTVETTTNQQGLIKYIGPIHVAEGSWLGIELPSAAGKNDGSVRGERYFTCPPGHGLFVRDTSILRIVSQPSLKAPPKPATKPAATSTSAKAAVPKPRPSSVVAAKPNPRISTINKRQSVAPTSTHTSLRAPVRKTSTAGISTTAPSTSSSTTRSSRDGNVETLQTKIRHLEKQHTENQERLQELGQVRDERDRFHTIIQKLQTKCQAQHQEITEQKALCQQLQSENDQVSRTAQEHEVDLEDALIDKEMAEERAEQAESELEALRAKVEERDMELEILREEAELFTTEMTSEEREEAGYYRLQHENDRLREALITLKEMTGEQEQDLKARVRELEVDLSVLDKAQQGVLELQEELANANAVAAHLRSQVDAAAEWEDVSIELTTRCHQLEDQVALQKSTIQDLESLRELSDELEIHHVEQEEELRTEVEAKDIELAEQRRRIETQETMIANHEDIVAKFRELVFELQGRMADAESSRNMTEGQVKDTTSRFNEVMDLNRRLRASNVQATTKEIASQLRALEAAEASERLKLLTETESNDFLASEPLHAYFASKRIAAKASLLSNLLAATDRQLSYNGGMDEALSRLLCAEAIKYLTIIKSGSDRLWSAMSTSYLPEFTQFGPTRSELATIEKSMDQGLDALRTDGINFVDLARSLERAAKSVDIVLGVHDIALAMLPEDVILARIQNTTANFEYLNSNFAIINTVLDVLAAHGAQGVLKRFAPSLLTCNKAMLSAQKLLRTTIGLRNDGLYPQFLAGSQDIVELEARMSQIAREATDLGRHALRIVSNAFDDDNTFNELELDLESLFGFYWSSDLLCLDQFAMQLDYCTDEVSVLMNSIEIAHGPTPWAQKAKLVQAARQQDSEASVYLDNLKAEHKATLLNLHERERVIETKSLEIEHLEAKYRDATHKVDDNQQLRDKIKEAEREVASLAQQVKSQQEQITTLEGQAARLDDHSPAIPTAPIPEPRELPVIPANVNCMLNALQDENHWLRHRENSALFDRSLREVFVHMQIARRAELFLAGHMTVEQYYECASIEWDDSDDDDVEAEKGAKAFSLPQEPLALSSASMGWRSRRLVEDLCTIMEEGDTLDLEEFSEIMM